MNRIERLRENLQSLVAVLPPETRTAWLWDMLTGICAGIYQGCIWTFVFRVARADLHSTPQQIAWMSAAPAVGYLFATFWARQMEGKTKMPFVYWTWLAARGLFLFAPFIKTPALFVLLVCAAPIIFSVSNPAYAAIMKEIYPDALRGRLMSFVRIGVYFSMLGSSLLMGRLLDHGLPWQTAFFIGGVFGTLSAITFRRIPLTPLPASEEGRGSTLAFFRDTFGILGRNPGYRWFIASVFVSGFGNLTSATLIPLRQVDYFHVTNTDIANMQNIASIATIIGFLFWGSFMDRRGSLATVLVALGFNLIVPFTYGFATQIWMLYFASACMGLAMSGIELSYLNTTLMFAEPGKTAQYQALHASFFGIRGTLAPLCAVPLMHRIGSQYAFLAAFGVLFAGALLQMVSMRDYRKQQE